MGSRFEGFALSFRGENSGCTYVEIFWCLLLPCFTGGGAGAVQSSRPNRHQVAQLRRALGKRKSARSKRKPTKPMRRQKEPSCSSAVPASANGRTWRRIFLASRWSTAASARSEIADSTFFADRIIVPLRAAQWLSFTLSGDNDLAGGKSAARVFADFQAFLKKIHQRLPEPRVAFISIKPCPSRWHLKDKVVEVNKKIAALRDDKLIFIDVYSPMLGDDGLPRPELFLADKLHPSATCYKLWAKLITPRLE